MAMTNEQLTKWIDEIFGTIDEIKTNSGDITGLTRSVKQLREDLTATQEDVTALETDTAGTVSLSKAQLQHFTDGSATQALDLVADIIPVQAGSGDPSPTNVRTISGYSSISARSNGKNFLPLTLAAVKACNTSGTWSGNSYTRYGCTLTFNTDENGYITSISRTGKPDSVFTITFSDYSNYTYFLPAGDYTLTGGKNNHEQIAVSRMVDGTSTRYGTDTGSGLNFTATASLVNIFMAIYTTVSTTSETYYPMIRLAADVDPAFKPYIDNTATLSLGRTIYGGSADFTTGAETETLDAIDLGDLTWQKATWAETPVFISSAVSDFAAPAEGSVPDAICEKYKPVSRNTLYYDGSVDNAFCISTGKNIVIRDSVLGEGDATAFTTAVNGVKLVAELATPNTYTTTPAQLSLLQGENNVSATSGPITLTYAPDNVLAEVYAYIQKRFDTLTASLAANRTTRKTTKTLTKKED